MDLEKQEISFRLLCNACLCVGNTLYQVTDEKLKHYYLSAVNEIPLCGVPSVLPHICWDCKALLRKSFEFKEQVKDSYRILMTYTTENLNECLLSDVPRSPRLKIKHNNSIDIDPEVPDYTYDMIDMCMRNDGQSYDEKTEDNQDPKMIINDVKIPGPKNTSPYSDIVLGYQKTQVFVKEENMKVEDFDTYRDTDFSDSQPEDSNSIQVDNLADLDDEIRTIINEVENGKETEENKSGKLKKSKKLEGVRKKKRVKKKEDPQAKTPNIRTIDLTYDEMMSERQIDCTRDNYVNSGYKCESCVIGFHYSKSFKKHVLKRHSPSIGKYNCPVCKTILTTVNSFTAHYKRHVRRYECSICLKRTMDLKSMQQHYYSTHDISLKKYKCADCGKISNSIDSHRYHTDSHKSRLQCPDCDKSFRHRGGLLTHRLAVHESRNSFPCKICDKVFRWKSSLKRHLDAHESKSQCPPVAAFCSLCSVSFASLSSYQRHMKNSLQHVTKDDFRFICDHCNRRFADKTKLRDHIEEKHLHKTYQCKICFKTSKNRVNLDQHIRNVHKGRPNNKMCHHCGKGFPTKVQLESHIRTHTGERPFICEYCPTTFSQQSNLYKHNRQVHLNMKTKRYPTVKKKKEDKQMDIAIAPTELPIDYPVDIGFI